MRVAVKPLVGTPVTPNQLTVLRLLTGLGAAAAFASGEQLWQNVGGGLFVFSALLDRADGELARLGGKTTDWGHTFDIVSDALCNALVLFGIGVGMRDSVLGGWAIPMGALAGVAVAAILMMVMRIENVAGKREAELRSMAGFDVDDLTLLIPLAMWLGWGVPLITAAAVVAPAVAVFFVLRFRAKLGFGRATIPDP